MRLLLLTETLHPDTTGGAGRVAAGLATHLSAIGHDVRVISRLTEKATSSFEERDGYQIFRFPVDRANPISLFTSTKRGVSESLARATRDWQPDIISAEQPHPVFHILDHQLLERVPLIYTFYSSWSDELSAKGGINHLLVPSATHIESKVLNRCWKIIVLSEWTRIRAKQIAPSVKFEIIPGGVDLERFTVHRRGKQNRVPTLLTIRNLVNRMGLDQLIEAAKILQERGLRFNLVIGGSGKLRAQLEKSAASLGPTCRFLGHIPEADLPDVYRDADLFVLPTARIEGFGLVILESFACGIPVVGTPVGAIPELVDLQGPGFVSQTAAASSIADVIESNLTQYNAKTSDSVRKIAENYAWSDRARKFADSCESLLAGR